MDHMRFKIISAVFVLCQILIEAKDQSHKIVHEAKSVTPKFVYGVFTEQCFNIFFHEFNFFNFPCLKMTIVKLLGYAVVTGASIVKLPQIIKIISKKSVFGVSFSSVTFEILTQIMSVTYSIYRQNPFSVYGESVFIAAQMFIIIILFMVYDKDRILTYLVTFLFMAGFAWLSTHPELVPVQILQNSIILQMILICIARIAQIIYIHQVKSTGSLALITCGLTVLGNLARMVTVFVEVKDDFKFQLSFVIATALNSYILFLFYFYREKKVKTDEKSEAKIAGKSE